MPKPENIRRIVTGPKPANRSIRKSRSMCRSRLYRSSRRTRDAYAVSSHLGRVVDSIAKSNGGVYGSRRSTGRRGGLDLRRRQLHRFAAAAGAGLVRIVEDELRRHLVDLVVHLGAEQKQHGLGIDQDLHALVLDDLVGGADIVGIFDRVGLPGAAAVLDSYPQPHALAIAP